ncbi:cutinase family protein [Rhodococcus opacus]|uniref:Cutinase n=1 Tax=Rhodococcus opacus (strain B4) TaxID=632772 RepID=C1B9E5_RHOOB|nr:cutinase family protein [Rhodococcus opacus]BAH52298.1 hypothetical protein ROP_40510 [Rhodococcus opacus B4]
MRRLAAVVLSCAMVVVGVVVAPAAAQAASCAHQIVVAVGGNGDPGAHAMSPALDRYRAGGADVRVVPYPASVWPLGPVSYDQSRAEGVPAAVHAIERARLECPRAEIVGTGYSLGASVMGDAVQVTWVRDRFRARLYADPRQPGGVETVWPTIVPGISMLGGRPPFPVPVEQDCLRGDGVCDMRRNVAGTVDSVAGYFTRHPNYGGIMATPDGAPGVRWY